MLPTLSNGQCVKPSHAETWIFQDIQVITKAADVQALSIPRSSATILLTKQDKRTLDFC